ncbi:uncharacterized protein LOC110929445 [Helianthus annuus]|uniref:uncharacterized protein LOC110929445 n=1 Tax=Helianthus annuus TaxID=4232 RepID=UPI000B8F4D99|nr:uncharacterized protein LOC110929445 [Helianthus annuus]
MHQYKVAFEQFKKEKDYWKQVIIRIVALVKFLAKYGLVFRGTNEKLYQKVNGNFLGLVEMLEEFDPIMKEHVCRVLNEECHVHFLGHNIQNELIQLLRDKVRTEIIKKVKQAKYYSSILDCTPYTSHQEQMSIIVREVGFSKALDEARKIANEICVNGEFRKKRVINRKKQFGESSSVEEVTFSPDEDFRTLNEANLKECCYRLQNALKYEGESDIDAKELCSELNLINTFLPRHIGNPFDVLDYIFQRSTTYPNVVNAYKVLLTIPVTVAGRKKFLKVEVVEDLFTFYNVTKRLNGLATISIESKILDTMDYKELIESLASKNARRTTLFAKQVGSIT